MVDPVSGEVSITHLDSKEDIIDQEHDHGKGRDIVIQKSEVTETCREGEGIFSFEGFIEYIDGYDQTNTIPRFSLNNETNILTWIPASPVLVRHKPPGEDLDDTLSHDIDKLQLTDQSDISEGIKDEAERDVTSHCTGHESPGLFSIIKIEEEHVKISQAIERAKRRHNILDKVTPGPKTQAHKGKGVVTGRFPVDKIYPPLPKTSDLTLTQ